MCRRIIAIASFPSPPQRASINEVPRGNELEEKQEGQRPALGAWAPLALFWLSSCSGGRREESSLIGRSQAGMNPCVPSRGMLGRQQGLERSQWATQHQEADEPVGTSQRPLDTMGIWLVLLWPEGTRRSSKLARLCCLGGGYLPEAGLGNGYKVHNSGCQHWRMVSPYDQLEDHISVDDSR